MALISKADAARALGVTKEAVYAAIRTNRLSVVRTGDGRELINSTTMREEWQRNTQKRIGRGPKPPAGTTERTPKRPGELTPAQRREQQAESGEASAADLNLARTTEDIPDYDVSRARTEHLKAELLELERKQKEQILVKAEEVEAKWVEIITMARTKILGIPTKAKQRIPDLDTDAIGLLDDIVRETLEDLATTSDA
jgi:phage terminase Nu1 subunit (DNA packaging protein)